MDGALFAARKILEEVTPLKADCGRVCGAACCASLEGEETGMLLFPGEEALCRQVPGGRIEETANGTLLLICRGTCDREERPLSCRLFPLFPCVRAGEVCLEVDERARLVCPLCASGVQGMLPDFREHVLECGKLLLGDARQRAFMEAQTRAMDDLKKLRRSFLAKGE